MNDKPGAAEIYFFLQLVERVAGDDASIRRRVETLSPDERDAVAREVLEYAKDMDNDDMGRYLVKESIRRALPHG